MKSKAESVGQFLAHKLNEFAGPKPQAERGSFNVFDIQQRMISGASPFLRRDFYKIMLFQGSNTFHFGDRSIPIKGNTLLFFNPMVPYAYEKLQKNTKGWFCVFKSEFMTEVLRFRIDDHPLFVAGAKPVFPLTAEQAAEMEVLFQKMQREFNSTFPYKYELIRSYVLELIYSSLKLTPETSPTEKGDAGTRITLVFKELLERQFPLETPSQRFHLRTPKDFAASLSIHVNHLNRLIKKTTGKSTSEHIFHRMIAEAKALLKHTDWTVAEIGYALGFEDPAHFTNFFKKHTRLTPLAFR